MKKIIFLIPIMTLFVSCGIENFKEMSNSEKEAVIKQNITNYVIENKTKTTFKNYFYLLEQSNKLKPCPQEQFKAIKVLFRDTIYAGLSLDLLSSYEYMLSDKKLGELMSYGIEFSINDSSGTIIGYTSYASFTKWDKGKIGERNSIGSKILDYNENSIIDFKDEYGNVELQKKLDAFFETEMKQKQIDNKHKCN